MPCVDRWDARLGSCLAGEGPSSCRISEHVPEQEKRRYVCVVRLRVGRSHQRQLRGFTTEHIGTGASDARQCGRMALRFRKPLGDRASGECGRPRSRITASTSQTVCKMSPRVCLRLSKSVSSLRSLPCAQHALSSILVRLRKKRTYCRGSQRSSTRRVDVSGREQKARPTQ